MEKNEQSKRKNIRPVTPLRVSIEEIINAKKEKDSKDRNRKS